MFSMLGANLDNFVSLGSVRGYDPFTYPYYVCLEDLPKKVMWTMLFNPSHDFSKAIDMVKRTLNVFGGVFIIASYLLFSKLWSQEFDKLLFALTTSDLIS